MSDLTGTSKPPLKRRVIIAVGAVLVLVLLVAGFKTWQIMGYIAAAKKNGAPAQTVTTTVASSSDWQPEVSAVGSVRAVRGVDVTTEVTGLVRSLEFHSGDEAKRGQEIGRASCRERV